MPTSGRLGRGALAASLLAALAASFPVALACPIESSVRYGDARRELTAEVRRWAPDLLVLGARGRTAGRGVRLGRVAEMLLRQARCPTLVYRR